VGVVVEDTPRSKKNSAWKRAISMHWVPVDYFHQHVIAEKLRLLEPFYQDKGLDLFAHPISVTPPKAQTLTPLIQSQIRQPYIVLHPGPLNAYKRWPLSYWQELITHLVNDGNQIILSSSPARQDLELNQDILSLLDINIRGSLINTEGRLSLPQAVTLLKGATLYIGVDTSVSHLSAACETPTIVLFGATPPTNFGPWPNGFVGQKPYQIRARMQIVKNVCILQGPGDCVPCRKAGCEDKSDSRSECLDLLKPNQVIEAVQRMLQR
jgi:heptosyltransferase-3